MAEHQNSEHVSVSVGKVKILGGDGKTHLVEATRVDEFYHGSDGRPLTDSEWDEMQHRKAEPLQINPDDYKVVLA